MRHLYIMIHCIYHWHSFVQIQSDQGDILIDPYITGNPQCDVTLEQVLQYNIRAICLSHGHHDHLWDTVSICAQIPQIPVIAMVELCEYLKQKGVWLTHSINVWWSLKLWTDTDIKYLKAEHSNSTPEGGYAGVACSILMHIWTKTIYHAGDTALHSDMKLLGDMEKIDCAFVPIWDRYTMWISDSIIATGWIKPKIVVPIHYNTRPSIRVNELERATHIMQDNIATPKVLHPGQYIIL